MSETMPKGQRFSHVYMQRGLPTNDSKRMRFKIGKLVSLIDNNVMCCDIGDVLEHNLGISVVNIVRYDGWEEFFSRIDICDVLDSLTILFSLLWGAGETDYAMTLVNGVVAIFSEENVSYRIDDKGGVHLAVDTEFEHNRASAIKALGSNRYAAVIAALEEAHSTLDGVPPDTKFAVRSAFGAVEILFRLICPQAPRLGAKEINTYLKPKIDDLCAEDATACRSMQKMLSSLSDWVDGVHFYRHEQGCEEPTQPPLSLAIFTVSTAASILRWLADFDHNGLPSGLSAGTLLETDH